MHIHVHVHDIYIYYFFYLFITKYSISDIPQCSNCSRRGSLFKCRKCVKNFTSLIPGNNYKSSQSNVNLQNTSIIKKEKRKYKKKKKDNIKEKGEEHNKTEDDLFLINKDSKIAENMDFANCFINESQSFNNLDNLENFYEYLS